MFRRSSDCIPERFPFLAGTSSNLLAVVLVPAVADPVALTGAAGPTEVALVQTQWGKGHFAESEAPDGEERAAVLLVETLRG
ncbi:hypothetical protein HDU96_003903 [Phlyctochytrium bullatum]|nr:hypothetical protein HDU96_003903 [Phlyctochytrium bullatum]